MMDFMGTAPPRRIDDDRDVMSMLADWPRDEPVAMLSSARRDSDWSRWSLLCSPKGHLRVDTASQRVHWSGPTRPPIDLPASSDDPLGLIQSLLDHTASSAGPELPFDRGWLAALSYELGTNIEPTARHRSRTGTWPMFDLLWCPAGLAFDHEHDRWWSFGNAEAPARASTRPSDGVRCSPPRSVPGEPEYIDHIQQVRDYIHEGDVFQANLARRLHASIEGDLRSMTLNALDSAGPMYGLYMELPDGNGDDRAILSLSPELYLQVDGVDDGRRVVTRPIKGTSAADRDPSELESSSKDAAELHMIVDLMRNDLGRVCEVGTVGVRHGRRIESHPTVHHGVGEVEGMLRPETTMADLLRATFPPGSVTGAPKIRAMQIIDELEPEPRGPYCGGLGWLTARTARLSVGIRTMAMTGRFTRGFRQFEGEVVYGTGGGIVSDSRPREEFEETCHKAAVFEAALGLSEPTSG